MSTVQIAIPIVLGSSPVIALFAASRLLAVSGETALVEIPGFRTLFAATIAAMAVAVPTIIIGVRRLVVTPLRTLTARAAGFPGSTPPVMRERYMVSEIHELAHSINDMMEAVMSREESLRNLNESLEDRIHERTRAHEETIDTLRSARDRLLLSEKMAALGSLVSGVAHEINTPLSIGVTAASYLNERAHALKDDFDGQSLTQDDLERFLTDSEEASRIIQNNLDQAAKIIGSLKQVAEDQQSDKRREFELGSYLKDIALSLKHLLRPGKHRLVVESEGVVLMNTFPGALSRIMNNLVLNSVTHGFVDREGGIIRIGCREDGNDAVLEYRDDGRGFDDESYGRLGGTGSGNGGPGLGMSIIRNLLAERLKGSLDIAPPDGGGARFTLHLPKNSGEGES